MPTVLASIDDHFFVTTFPTKPQLRHLHLLPRPLCFIVRPHFGHLIDATVVRCSRAAARRMLLAIDDIASPPFEIVGATRADPPRRLCA
jgi:hypothetical protein